MSEFSDLSRLVYSVSPEGDSPGAVEVSRSPGQGPLVAKMWSHRITGTTTRTFTLGGDILIAGESPVGIPVTNSGWSLPSVLAAERLGPVPEGLTTGYVTGARRSASGPIVDPRAQALADEATRIITESAPVMRRECEDCAGSGCGYQRCPCTLFGINSGVINIDHPSEPNNGQADPECSSCGGSGRCEGACLYCGGAGFLCAPYDITVILDGERVTIPGQPGQLAALAGVQAISGRYHTSWTLTQRGLLSGLIPDGFKLFTTAGYPIMGTPERQSSVVVSGDQPWPDAHQIAEELIHGLSHQISMRFPHDISEHQAERSGLVISEGIIRGVELVARPPVDGYQALAELVDRVSAAGLRVLLTVGFIATGEWGPRVSALTPDGEVAWSGEEWWSLEDAIQEALVVWG